VAFGRRAAEDAEAHGSQRIEATEIRVVDFAEVRKRGASDAIHRAIEYLSGPRLLVFG
jgi:arginase